MSSYFNLTIDTVAPSNVGIVINNGDTATSSALVNLALTSSDTDTTQMKIWGYSGCVEETDASWETFATTKQVSLTSGDGAKTVYAKFRDDVLNESAQVSDTITLNTSVPTVTAVVNNSKISSYVDATVTFSASEAFSEFKVCIVPATNSTQSSGTTIPTTNGSVGTIGTGTYTGTTEYTATIKCADVLLASTGDGQKIVKVFVKSSVGTWSV